MTVLDDLDSRPGSVVSLVRTVVGLYLRRLGGWISIADLVRVMERIGVTPALTRTAVTRLKSRGLLVPDRRGAMTGYRLNELAMQMLEAGDRRIFHPRRMHDGDPWCLISFSIPEGQRAARHQLRRRLQGIGCGTVSPALWICPATLADEVEAILSDVGVREFATLFEATAPRVAGSLAGSVREWWDLDALASIHRSFIEGAGPLVRGGGDVLTRYVRGIDLWRPIPYLDPGLADAVLPAGWPGHDSEELYAALSGLAGDAWLRLSDDLQLVRSDDAARDAAVQH